MNIMRYLLFFVLLFATSTGGLAQANRVRQIPSDSTDKTVPISISNEAEISAEQLYQEVESYTKKKVAEFQAKKIPYSDALYKQTVREQKQLAAKYAASLAARQNLPNEDFYFRGMLHSMAENFDGAAEDLTKFLESENSASEKAQAARFVGAVASVRRKNLEQSEKLLAEYLKNAPVKLRERHKIESELAKAYLKERNFSQAAAHAEEAYRASKIMFSETSSRARAVTDVLDSGNAAFEIYRASGNQNQADATLEDMRRTAALIASNGVYYYAVDSRIKYMVETNRKPEALKFYKAALKQVEKDFAVKSLQEDVIRRLEKRDKQYRLLGDAAPELVSVDRTTSAETKKLSSLRGKVVLLDFWATWCGPCIATFPALVEWHETYQKDGLEILGLTRYYGEVQGENADHNTEFDFLTRFKKENNLSYDLVVSRDTTNQITYGATSIPTTVLIDRKGIVRYVETGASPEKEAEIRLMIEKLLAEK